MPDFTNAKVGDKVWNINGPEVEVGETNAIIRLITPDSYWPIVVNNNSYSRDGKQNYDNALPSIYWARPEIRETAGPPIRKVKKTVWLVYNPGYLSISDWCVYDDEVQARECHGDAQIFPFEVEIEE